MVPVTQADVNQEAFDELELAVIDPPTIPQESHSSPHAGQISFLILKSGLALWPDFLFTPPVTTVLAELGGGSDGPASLVVADLPEANPLTEKFA